MLETPIQCLVWDDPECSGHSVPQLLSPHATAAEAWGPWRLCSTQGETPRREAGALQLGNSPRPLQLWKKSTQQHGPSTVRKTKGVKGASTENRGSPSPHLSGSAFWRVSPTFPSIFPVSFWQLLKKFLIMLFCYLPFFHSSRFLLVRSIEKVP